MLLLSYRRKVKKPQVETHSLRYRDCLYIRHLTFATFGLPKWEVGTPHLSCRWRNGCPGRWTDDYTIHTVQNQQARGSCWTSGTSTAQVGQGSPFWEQKSNPWEGLEDRVLMGRVAGSTSKAAFYCGPGRHTEGSPGPQHPREVTVKF